MTIVRRTIPEHERRVRRLGRHVAHDPRSRDFPAQEAPAVISVTHRTTALPLDQGQLGSCTGNAMTGLLMSQPFFNPARMLNETDALMLYSRATHLDRVRGAYPPTDTGSAGLFVAKAAKEKGWCSSYKHAFGLNHTLKALVLKPVIIGVDWYDSFDRPDANHFVSITPGASIAGGHEFLLFGINVEQRAVLAMNSWGTSWADRGVFRISWDTLAQLLAQQGDVTTVEP